ncbi:hypothetical protein JHK87_015786 [Glycine soja]|nr:hypothetical protein JHK87_015786 [Glycine soja]
MVFKDDKKVELMKENLRGDCLRGDGDKMGSVRKNTVASGNREDMVNTYEEPPDPGDHKYALVPRAIRDMETNVNVGGQPEMVEETMEGVTCRRNQIHMKEVMIKWKPDFFEVHTQFVKTSTFWRMSIYEPVYIQEARGQLGGIWVLRRNDSPYSFTTYDVHPQCISVLIEFRRQSWLCLGVYASPRADSMKKDSIIFNKEVFGSIFRRKKELQFRITGLEKYLKTVDSVRDWILFHIYFFNNIS